MDFCLRLCVMQWFNIFLKGPRILPFLPITMESHLHPPSVKSWMVNSINLGELFYYKWSAVWLFNYSLHWCDEGRHQSLSQFWFKSVCLLHWCFQGIWYGQPSHFVWKVTVKRDPQTSNMLAIQWFKSQQLCVRWMSRSSGYFQVSNGVQQDGVLSPILFMIYMDSLLESLKVSWRSWFYTHFAGAFCYADDLAPSPDALRKTIAECESFAESHGLWFNAAKTQLICFGDHFHLLKLNSGSVSTSYRLLTRLFILVTYCSLIFLTSMIFSASQCPFSVKLISFCYASDALPFRIRWGCFRLIVCHSMVALWGGLIVMNWNLSGYLLTMF